MEYIVEVYVALFGRWLSKTFLRVVLGAAILSIPFLLVSFGLWMSDSNLWIFAGTIASKVAALFVALFGLLASLCALGALAE